MEIITRVLLGALIGYITNYIAVKMIFRPHRSYFLFGLRIPFTPGLIYNRKWVFASNIGKIVEQDLLHQAKIKRIAVSRIKKYLPIKGIVDKSLLFFFSTIPQHLLEKYLKHIRVGQIVNDEIMALDTSELERVVRKVYHKEFYCIQLFGAMIGAVIGLLQGFISY